MVWVGGWKEECCCCKLCCLPSLQLPAGRMEACNMRGPWVHRKAACVEYSTTPLASCPALQPWISSSWKTGRGQYATW